MSACRLLGGRSFSSDIKHDRGRRTLVEPSPSVSYALKKVEAPDFSRGEQRFSAAERNRSPYINAALAAYLRPGIVGPPFSREPRSMNASVRESRTVRGEQKANRDNAKIKNRHNALQRKEIAKPNSDKNASCPSPHLHPKLRDSGHSPLATGLCYFRADMKKRIGVLLSGRGSNFEALADSVAAGRIPNAEIAIVLSNREGAPGIDKARERGIPAQAIPSKGLEREPYDKLVVAALREKNVELVCLAGYMRLLSPLFCCGVPESHSEYSSVAAAGVSRA